MRLRMSVVSDELSDAGRPSTAYGHELCRTGGGRRRNSEPRSVQPSPTRSRRVKAVKPLSPTESKPVRLCLSPRNGLSGRCRMAPVSCLRLMRTHTSKCESIRPEWPSFLEEVRLGQSQSKPVKANQAWKRFGTAIDEQEVVKKFLASA